MRADEIKQSAEGFATYWNNVFSDSPRYQLDFTWPSLGVVNGILANLRGKKELDEFDRAQLLGASSYIGSLAYACWAQFAGEPKVKLSLSRAKDAVLKITGGKNLSGETSFEVNITAALRDILAAPKNPFPFFEQYSRELPPNANLVMLFALGLASGLCPYGSGPWKDQPVTALQSNVDAANILLAESCAEYYARVFPSEPLGTKPELYRSCLIFPPLGFSESGIATRAVHGLVTCLKRIAADEAEMTTLALNLASFPDEVISAAGFAVSVALCKGKPPASLRLLSEQLGHFKLVLRPAIFMARDMLHETELPTMLIAKEEYVKAENLLRVEAELGLLPLVKLDVGYLLRKDLLHALNFLFWPQAASARDAFMQYLAETDSASAKLQLAYLHLFTANPAAAREIIFNISPEALDDPKLRALDAELRGYLFLEEKNFVQAAACFAEGAAEEKLPAETRELLTNLQAEAYGAAGEREKIRELFAHYGEHKNYSLRTLGHRLQFLEDEHDFRTAVDSVRRLVPYEPRLFQLYLRQRLRELAG